jgi:hypothetical protein
LSVEQVLDDVLDVGCLDVAFAVDQAERAEVIDNKADVLILAGDDRRRPFGTHYNTAFRLPSQE